MGVQRHRKGQKEAFRHSCEVPYPTVLRTELPPRKLRGHREPQLDRGLEVRAEQGRGLSNAVGLPVAQLLSRSTAGKGLLLMKGLLGVRTPS